MGKHYDYAHQQQRAKWKPTVDAGLATCHAKRCLMSSRIIVPDYTKRGDGWDVGHSEDRSRWTGPEHARCNRSEGATRGNKARGRAKNRRVWSL